MSSLFLGISEIHTYGLGSEDNSTVTGVGESLLSHNEASSADAEMRVAMLPEKLRSDIRTCDF